MHVRKKPVWTVKMNSTQRRLYLAAAIILLVGAATAVVVFLTAGTAPEGGLVEEFLDSKRYAHELRAYGGNATLLADEFVRWFEGLWHGRALAYTIACITVFLSSGLWLVGWHILPDTTTDDREEESRDQTD